MDTGKKFEWEVESATTRKEERVIRTIRMKTDSAPEKELFIHFSFRDGIFYAAMKRAKLEGFSKTFASGFYFTAALPEDFTEGTDSDPAVWMPVETEEDRNFLFSEKPWEECESDPSAKTKLAECIGEAFDAFQKEMLS